MRLLATFDDTCLNYIMQTFIYVVYSFCEIFTKKMVVAAGAPVLKAPPTQQQTIFMQATGSVSVSI